MASHRLSTAAMALVLVLAGCAADKVNYPSLARRPIEKVSETAAATAPPPAQTAVAPVNPELSGRVASLVAKAREAHVAFVGKQAHDVQLVTAGSGAAQGSEAWATASIALADLESARSLAMVPLADLDQMFAAASIEGSDITAIAAGRDQVGGWVAEEDAVLAGLRGRVPN